MGYKATPFYKEFLSPAIRLFKAYRQNKLSDEAYFMKRHKKLFGYTPDFSNPKTFNEKVIHRILFERNPLFTALADKLKARIYIASRLSMGGGGQQPATPKRLIMKRVS